MTAMDDGYEGIDVVIHYGLRIVLAASLIGIAVAAYALAMGWK